MLMTALATSILMGRLQVPKQGKSGVWKLTSSPPPPPPPLPSPTIKAQVEQVRRPAENGATCISPHDVRVLGVYLPGALRGIKGSGSPEILRAFCTCITPLNG